MNEFDEVCLEYFLAHQEQLLPEPVAETMEEAEEFLEDCMAVVCKNLKEVKAYFEDQGASEVFALPDGRYLIVEA